MRRCCLLLLFEVALLMTKINNQAPVSPVFHVEAAVSIGLKNVLRVKVLTLKHLYNNNSKMKLCNPLLTFIWDNKEG